MTGTLWVWLAGCVLAEKGVLDELPVEEGGTTDGGNPFLADDDSDGWTESGGDCDDTEGSIHPGAAEICDDVDQDCDGAVNEDFIDEYEPNDLEDDETVVGGFYLPGNSYSISDISLHTSEDVDHFALQFPPGLASECDAYVIVESSTLDEFQATIHDEWGMVDQDATAKDGSLEFTLANIDCDDQELHLEIKGPGLDDGSLSCSPDLSVFVDFD